MRVNTRDAGRNRLTALDVLQSSAPWQLFIDGNVGDDTSMIDYWHSMPAVSPSSLWGLALITRKCQDVIQLLKGSSTAYSLLTVSVGFSMSSIPWKWDPLFDSLIYHVIT